MARLELEIDPKGAEEGTVKVKNGLDGVKKSAAGAEAALKTVSTGSKALKAEVAQLRASIAGAEVELKKLQAAGKGTDASTKALKASLAGLRTELAQNRATAAQAAAQVTALGNANQVAAGQTGNIAAQLNDVFVTLQAGQSPFQVAIQQGSQLNQVFSQLGGGKQIFSALAGAVTSFLNPISLATFAVIAFGGAAIQWFTDSGDAAESLEDRMSGLADAVDRARESISASIQPAADLAATYGSMAGEAQKALHQIAAFDTATALQTLNTEADALALTFGSYEQIFRGGGLSDALATLQSDFGLTKQEATGVIEALQALSAAEGPQATADAAARLSAELDRAFASAGTIPPEIVAVQAALAQTVVEAANLQGGIENANGSANTLLGTANALLSAIQAAAGADLSGIFSRAQGVANTLLATARNIAAAMQNAANVNAGNAFAITQGGQAQIKYGGRTPGGTPDQQAIADRYAPAIVPSLGAGGGGGGGAATEAAGVDQLKAAYDSLIGSLDETARAQAQLDAGTKAVNEALAAGVINADQAKEAMGRLQQRYLEATDSMAAAAARVKDSLDKALDPGAQYEQAAKGIFGAFESFFLNPFDKGLKGLLLSIVGVFQKIAAQALASQITKFLFPAGGGGILAGLFDAGGYIPRGGYGIVAERRPELVDGRLVSQPSLVKGPAKVTGGAATGRMLGGGGGGGTPEVNLTTIVVESEEAAKRYITRPQNKAQLTRVVQPARMWRGA